MKNTITIIDIDNHITEWFGSNWNNQPSAQMYAMVINLLKKVNVEIMSEEDLKNESDLNALENQTGE